MAFDGLNVDSENQHQNRQATLLMTNGGWRYSLTRRRWRYSSTWQCRSKVTEGNLS